MTAIPISLTLDPADLPLGPQGNPGPKGDKGDPGASASSVKDHGAVGNGVADDTPAVNAYIAAQNLLDRKRMYFPHGQYRVTEALTPLVGNNWDICGDGYGATSIITTADADVFSLDVSAADSFFGCIRDMTIERVPGGAYSNSCGFSVLTNPASVTGAQYWQFQSLVLRNLYRGIRVGDTGKVAWGGFTDIARHGFLVFENIISPVATDPMFETISFDGGCGPHLHIEEGHLRGTGAAIKIGNGNDNVAVGDILITDAHIVTADVGMDIIGPSNAGSYNQNVTISGCQFDNCATATVRMARMKNFRIIPNNSTASVGMSLTNCSDFIVEDRNCLSGIRYNEALIARRSVNDQWVAITGGSSLGAGANLELYGGAHQTLADHAYLDTARLQVRSQSGVTVFLEVSAAALKALIGGSLKTVSEGAADSGGAGYRVLRVAN